jgi:hypothetical protein
VGGVSGVESAIFKRNTAGFLRKGEAAFSESLDNCEECLKAGGNGDRMVEPTNAEIRVGCGQARMMWLAASSPLLDSDILEVIP